MSADARGADTVLRVAGFPASNWLVKVQPNRNIPVNAIIVSALVPSMLSLINLGMPPDKPHTYIPGIRLSQLMLTTAGSYTALNAFNSLGTISILFSYNITIGCLIWRRLFGTSLPHRRWSLGPRMGLMVNVFALGFTTPMLFFYTWPLYYPVTTNSM